MTTLTQKEKGARTIEVLIIEDNMGDVLLIKEALKTHPRLIKLTLARDGKEAMDCLNGAGRFDKAHRPDVILLDLSLPGKSGFEVLADIRANSALNETPVIILTNSSSERDMRRAYDSSANFYIKKPNNLDEVFVAIHHVADIWLKGVRE